MRRAMLAGAMMLMGLCGPALAFDFTPRTFRTLYTAHFRSTRLLDGDLCGSAARDITCSYGIDGKEPIASISNEGAKGDRANSASLAWPVTLPLQAHVDQLRAFVTICTPRADEARRGILVGRLLDQGLHPTPKAPPRGYLLDGVRYGLTVDADGVMTVQADDLRMPAPPDVSDGWGATDEIK